jgi:hypothetical protein
MISFDIRRGQLARLTETLGDVLSILRLDPLCQWTPQFEQFLERAQQLAKDAFTQDELDEFSRSVCHVFDSHRSEFAQYHPPPHLPRADNFETFARATHERALELRVIGHH